MELLEIIKRVKWFIIAFGVLSLIVAIWATIKAFSGDISMQDLSDILLKALSFWLITSFSVVMIRMALELS